MIMSQSLSDLAFVEKRIKEQEDYIEDRRLLAEGVPGTSKYEREQEVIGSARGVLARFYEAYFALKSNHT